MRALVCGGRDFDDAEAVWAKLDWMHSWEGLDVVIQGGASGADKAAMQWAIARRCHYVTEFAEWQKHGKAAGPLRNQLMLDKHKPDLVVAFPGGSGTEDMIRRALKAGVKVQRMIRKVHVTYQSQEEPATTAARSAPSGR